MREIRGCLIGWRAPGVYEEEDGFSLSKRACRRGVGMLMHGELDLPSMTTAIAMLNFAGQYDEPCLDCLQSLPHGWL